MKLVLGKGQRLRIYTSLVDSAMGIHEMLIHKAAELLEIDPQKVTVQAVDTQNVPDTGPTILSRAVSFGPPLLEQCCAAIQRKRKEGVLPIEVRRSLPAVRPQPAKTDQTTRRTRRAGDERSELSWAATVVEVELDPVTFQSMCKGVWMAIETGTTWSRTTILSVLEGEILRSLGATRLPGYTAAPDSVRPACSSRNLIPAATEIPEIQIKLVETQDTAMKGFEHLPYLGVPAAYAAAVCQATGLYIDQLPITAEVIQQCLET
jgi:CO/xanthine dehydrogenase Mo-binding subunit